MLSKLLGLEVICFLFLFVLSVFNYFLLVSEMVNFEIRLTYWPMYCVLLQMNRTNMQTELYILQCISIDEMLHYFDQQVETVPKTAHRFCNLVVSGSEWSYLKIIGKTGTKPTRLIWSGLILIKSLEMLLCCHYHNLYLPYLHRATWTCGSRIGLHSHQRTHRLKWTSSSDFDGQPKKRRNIGPWKSISFFLLKALCIRAFNTINNILLANVAVVMLGNSLNISSVLFFSFAQC